MTTKLLYSNIWPLLVKKNQEIISDCFKREFKNADQLKIAVGFASRDSLKELERLVEEQNIKKICVILGIYYFSGFPEPLLELALEINHKWQQAGIGEIRVTNSFKYHGKLYCFMKDDHIFSAILGSPNLSFLKDTEITREFQYELALFTNDSQILEDSLEHINELETQDISENIAVLEEQELFSDENVRLRIQQAFKIWWKTIPR